MKSRKTNKLKSKKQIALNKKLKNTNPHRIAICFEIPFHRPRVYENLDSCSASCTQTLQGLSMNLQYIFLVVKVPYICYSGGRGF